MKNFYLNVSAACTNLDEAQKDFDTLQLLNAKVLMKEEITKSYEEQFIIVCNVNIILFVFLIIYNC